MGLYSMRDAANIIINKEFIHGKYSKEKMFRKVLEIKNIIYYNECRNKYYNKKWMFNWEIINYYYPEFSDCFEDYYTSKGYYQPMITEIGIEKLKELFYEIY